MAFVLKKPFQQSKGVIIFRNAERKFFQSEDPWMKEAVETLTKQYIIGNHWGWNHENVQDIPHISFHLAGKTTITQAPGAKTPWIPYNSRNFVPGFFCPNPAVKPHWDIICVSNAVKFKRLDEFLKTLRLIYDKRPQTRVLMICPEDADAVVMHPKSNWYADLPKDFMKMFSPKEREQIDLIRLKRFEGLYPITAETMAYFYQSSRISTLFTDKEGASRVISESILCGLPMVVKRSLKGGGLDYLDADNSRQFSSIEEAAEQFIALLDEPYAGFDRERIAQELCEDYTVPKLEAELKALFAELGEMFEGPWDNTHLFRKLPGHANLLPPDMVDPATKIDDLGYQVNFLKFTDYVCGTSLLQKYQKEAARRDRMNRFDANMSKNYFGRRLKKVFSFIR